MALAPSRVVALSRAVAELEGPEAALDAVYDLGLDTYHLFHAVRADLLRRVGRTAEAEAAYAAAIERTANEAERACLERSGRGLR